MLKAPFLSYFNQYFLWFYCIQFRHGSFCSRWASQWYRRWTKCPLISSNLWLSSPLFLITIQLGKKKDGLGRMPLVFQEWFSGFDRLHHRNHHIGLFPIFIILMWILALLWELCNQHSNCKVKKCEVRLGHILLMDWDLTLVVRPLNRSYHYKQSSIY